MIVADSGALYALYDADDVHHEAVRRIVEAEREPIIVPVAILGEVDYLLREFLGVEAELDFLGSLLDGAFITQDLDARDLIRARGLIDRYRSLDLGLADSVVIATAERLRTRKILTVDLRDFRAVRPVDGGYFTLLPADAG